MGILGSTVRFPNMGIVLDNVGKNISVFGFKIAYYGIIIAIGIVVGYAIAQWQAKRTGQDTELYLDFAMYVIVLSIIGARIYYVIFKWEDYKDDLLEIFNTRGGGLAIYGGVITAIITAYVYAKIKKQSFALICDTGCAGLIAGQAIGRWGNFFNKEAFGSYTNNIFAMQLRRIDVSSEALMNDARYLENAVTINGTEFIQVHPTFLYESVCNFILLVFLILYTKHKKFDGELILLYLGGYGVIRAFVEGLRTDQLLLWDTHIPVSQLLAIIMAVVSFGIIIYIRVRIHKHPDMKVTCTKVIPREKKKSAKA